MSRRPSNGHEVGVPVGPEGAIDGKVRKVLRVLPHHLLTEAMVHVAQPTVVGLLVDETQVSEVQLELF